MPSFVSICYINKGLRMLIYLVRYLQIYLEANQLFFVTIRVDLDRFRWKW